MILGQNNISVTKTINTFKQESQWNTLQYNEEDDKKN